MSTIITTSFAGQVAVNPNLIRIDTTESFATITTAGWLNQFIQQLGTEFSPTDIAAVSYSGSNTQFFSLSFSDTQITLVPMAGNVTLPVVSGHLATFNGTAGDLQDSGIASNIVLTTNITTPDTSPNLVRFNVTVGFAALATGGSVTLIDSSGTKRYSLISLQLNSGGTNFSGGGGDRLGQITDNTTVYSVIPAATMQSLVNAQWGVTALPNPASAAINTQTVAGADLVFKYSGGTTDYTAGSLVISGLAVRTA